MLVQTLIRYLASHKRLVVPQLGAFIVKTPGEAVVFSELLRTDDGVLRNLLCAGGMNELEAAGAVDRFVFEVRHTLQSGREFVLPDFGILRPGPNATAVFTYDPSVAAVKTESRPRVAEPQYSEPRITLSPKIHPDPSVKGLRYGKPEKTTAGYRYVDRVPRRRSFDKLLLVAIAASIVALATIAYVYIRDSRSGEPDGTELIQPDYTDPFLPADAEQPLPETSTQQP